MRNMIFSKPVGKRYRYRLKNGFGTFHAIDDAEAIAHVSKFKTLELLVREDDDWHDFVVFNKESNT